MMSMRMVEPSGHVFRVDRRRGPIWYAKYRLPDGRQVQKKIGPAWTQRGRPAAGFHTKRTAEAWLRDVLDQARRGVLPGMAQTGVIFTVAVDEYLRWLEVDRERKPSTLRDYRSIIRTHLLPAFGEQLVEDITYDHVERWRLGLPAISNRTKVKIITVLYGIMERARRTHRLPFNPVRDIEKPIARVRVELDVFSPEDVWALVRAADSEQDAAVFLTAAFTGLCRGELVALLWRYVDFAGSHLRVARSYTEGHLTTPKSGRIRSVPMAPDVATTLARLGQRDHATGLEGLVFSGPLAEFLDASALYRRYKAALTRAGLRPVRFHDLRHTSARPRFARRRFCRSRRGWVTRTSRRPCATCTTRRDQRTRNSLPKRSRRVRPQPLPPRRAQSFLRRNGGRACVQRTGSDIVPCMQGSGAGRRAAVTIFGRIARWFDRHRWIGVLVDVAFAALWWVFALAHHELFWYFIAAGWTMRAAVSHLWVLPRRRDRDTARP